LFHDQRFAEERLAHPPDGDALEIIFQNRFAAARVAWEPRMHDPDLHKWLHRVRIPALVIWGAEDRVLDPAYAEEWARLLPDSRVAVIPDCGHLPFVERPDAVAARIEDFAAEIAR
jgi:pimeloyl-ACP methyl ester carboxylesterase